MSPSWQRARPTIHSMIVGILAAAAIGCASREYLTPPILAEVRERDPEFSRLRVYANVTFVADYKRDLGKKTEVGGQQGAVQTGIRGEHVQVPVGRKLQGAIVALESRAGVPQLWVSFDSSCASKTCAFGFVMSSDRLFRLTDVPTIRGFSEAQVYRKRIAPRRLMSKSRLYSGAGDVEVYLTTRGFPASVALEIKKRKKVDIDTYVLPQKGVPTEKQK